MSTWKTTFAAVLVLAAAPAFAGNGSEGRSIEVREEQALLKVEYQRYRARQPATAVPPSLEQSQPETSPPAGQSQPEGQVPPQEKEPSSSY